MWKHIFRYFDKLEDRVRGRLSRYPIFYSILGGTAIVLFWRGVWITADEIMLYLPDQYMWLDGPISVFVSIFILLLTGLFVSFFVTDRIILSGWRQEKKAVERTETEVREESDILVELEKKFDHLEREMKEVHDKVV